MSLFHMNVKTGSRGGGQSAAAKADYILREGKYAGDADEVMAWDYDHMPAWAEEDPRVYWTAADEHERANGRLFVEVEVALPREFDQGQRIDAMRNLAQHVAGPEQLPHMWVIHRGLDAEGRDHNPHGHLMVSERGLDGYDRSPETWCKRYNGKDPEAGGARKTKVLMPKKWLTDLRAWWAGHLNERLPKHREVDHRSYIEQGVLRLPQPHLGPCSWHALQNGRTTPRTERFEHMETLNRDLAGWADGREPMPEHVVDESRYVLEALAFEDEPVAPRWERLIDYHRAAVEYLKRAWALVWDRKYGMLSGEPDDQLAAPRETDDRLREAEPEQGREQGQERLELRERPRPRPEDRPPPRGQW